MGRLKNKVIFTIWLIALTVSVPSFAEGMSPRDSENGSSYCEQIVSLHGLLTRAQLECGYEEYNEELIADSAKCFKHELGEEYGKKVLKFGMVEFDRNKKEVGHKNICADLLKEFPQYVR